MISEQAKQGLDYIFAKAARATLAVEDSDTIEIEPLRVAQTIEAPESQILVLTIASYVFRLLILFHINKDQATEHYFTKTNPGQALDEVIGEIGNMCCGAINRDLGNHFPHTGMSTPYLLKSQCLPHLKELKPNYVSLHRIGINDSVRMHATLCLCAYAPIDFKADMSHAEEVTGELELF